jgi:hypothetical protein
MRIQAMDIVQPPGIGIPGIRDIEAHQKMVRATLRMKRRVATA